MWRSRLAWTELYATVAGVGVDMRAKMACGGRVTSETARLAKEPGLCSTRRRRERSGWTHAGMVEGEVCGRTVSWVEVVMMGLVEDLMGWDLPLEEGGVGEVIAAGDMVSLGKTGIEYVRYGYRNMVGLVSQCNSSTVQRYLCL
jgi:hypothetical protein